MPAKGVKQPRLCRICGETNPAKFQCRLATMCGKCRQSRYKSCVTQCTVRTRQAEKLAAMAYYGPSSEPRCSWPNCAVDDIDMLVLDHILDNGAQERQAASNCGRGHELYRRLKRECYPEGYQTLCCNHNHKKELLRSRAKEK